MQHYAELDKILDVIEPIFLSLAGTQRLLGASIERWRWDEPDIMLRWQQRDPHIEKNIHLLMRDGEDTTVSLVIDVNAWFDEDLDGGSRRLRRWKCEYLDQDLSVRSASELQAQAPKLMALVGTAYDKVAQWAKENLDCTESL